MTIIQKVEIGKDIKKLKNHSDIYNLSNKKILDLDDDLFYLVEKFVGYYKPQKKSGLFLLKIEEVTEERMMGMLDV